MSKPETTIKRVTPTEQEIPAIARLVQAMQLEHGQAKLVGPDGEAIELPETVYDMLRDVLYLLENRQAVTITPADSELSTQEAADFLNVSRPFLYRLLDEGQINCHKVGTHRRIRFEDLLIYKQLRDIKRREGLKRLTQSSEAMGLYDEDGSEVESDPCPTTD